MGGQFVTAAFFVPLELRPASNATLLEALGCAFPVLYLGDVVVRDWLEPPGLLAERDELPRRARVAALCPARRGSMVLIELAPPGPRQESCMPKLIRVGFFREMKHGEPSDPSLAAARADAPQPHQDALAAYLAAGHVYIATPGLAKDVFDRKTVIGPPSYLTDGTYVWPGDVAYYVRTYNVRLPTAFLDHALALGFTVPASVDRSQLQL